MARDAYFSFGDEEPHAPSIGAPLGPGLGEDSLVAAGVADPFRDADERRPPASGRVAGPRDGSARGAAWTTPARLSALVALIVAALLVGHTLAGLLLGGSGGTHRGAAPVGVAERAGARALAPSRPGITAAGEGRPRRQTAEQEDVRRRRSQTRRHARRHRDRRPAARRDLSAGRKRSAPEAPTSEPTETEAPQTAEPIEAEAPPVTEPSEAAVETEAEPSYTPPPTEPAPEPPTEPAGPPHIRDGAHSPEFGLQ